MMASACRVTGGDHAELASTVHLPRGVFQNRKAVLKGEAAGRTHMAFAAAGLRGRRAARIRWRRAVSSSTEGAE